MMRFLDYVIYVMALIGIGLSSIAVVKSLFMCDWGKVLFTLVLFVFSLIFVVSLFYEIAGVDEDEFVG